MIQICLICTQLMKSVQTKRATQVCCQNSQAGPEKGNIKRERANTQRKIRGYTLHVFLCVNSWYQRLVICHPPSLSILTFFFFWAVFCITTLLSIALMNQSCLMSTLYLSTVWICLKPLHYYFFSEGEGDCPSEILLKEIKVFTG
jgi:hypothetical protein